MMMVITIMMSVAMKLKMVIDDGKNVGGHEIVIMVLVW